MLREIWQMADENQQKITCIISAACHEENRVATMCHFPAAGRFELPLARMSNFW